MTAKDAIKRSLDSNHGLFKMFLADLSDADLLIRPVPGANHIAWQLGHLIASEVKLTGNIGTPATPLPTSFVERHSNQTNGDDTPKNFCTKQEYLDLYDKAREATMAHLAKLSDADLDTATAGSMAAYAPTYGALFLLLADHQMMHAGQFTVLRRKLGKPVLF